jgi:acetyltransferase
MGQRANAALHGTVVVSLRNLDRIFRAHRVAVVGASNDPRSLGGIVLHNLVSGTFGGVVYPVSDEQESVQGILAYPTLNRLPRTPDLAMICTPAESVPQIVRGCAENGILGVVILSAGFREAGKEGRRLERRIAQEARRCDGLRIVGPNCLGFIVPSLGLNASLAPAAPKAGHVALISQSGALSTAVLDWALEQDIGFSHFVSVGNMLDVGFGDLIDYVGSDADTRSIILYMQSLDEARRFLSAARAFARSKPIVAFKSGRFAESAQAAASHTGAMAVEDAVYEAAFERAGIVRVGEIDDVFDCAELLARRRPPAGPRLAIITNAGGPAIIASDALLSRQGILASLAEETFNRLDAMLPPTWSRGNPVDILDDAPPARFGQVTQVVVADPGVDAVLVILAPQAMADPTASAQVVGALAEHTQKPILASWMGGGRVQEGLRVLSRAGVPSYTTPEAAVRAFMHLVSYARNLETLYETPRDIPLGFTLNRQTVRRRFRKLITQRVEVLSERQSKALIKAYQIPVNRTYNAADCEAAVVAAQRCGYPVVVKVYSPQILHKTEVGGVALNLQNDAEVRSACAGIMSRARKLRPDAALEGVTVQHMVNIHGGLEMIMGAHRDPTFGSVIMVGMGGIATGVYLDRSLGLPPLNERLARRMLESLRSWPLLQGYRGHPGVNVERLIETLMRFSYLVADYPEIRELDVNPLLVTPHDLVALDARIVLDSHLLGRARQYAHLAICPYPEEYVRPATLKDGTPVVLRPIKPEDEPLWQALLQMASPESIRFRFRSLFKSTTHAIAARYCYIDYQREVSIVAETAVQGERKLIGVGGLSADADHETAEFAVLVADPWQGRGLGGMLLDYSLQIARTWGVSRVLAETDPANARMLQLFRKRGFHLSQDREQGVVLLDKVLG